MTKDEKKSLAIAALRSMRGDDYERALGAFAKFSSDEMDEPHGQSGRTRRECLETYKRRADMFAETVAWLESI